MDYALAKGFTTSLFESLPRRIDAIVESLQHSLLEHRLPAKSAVWPKFLTEIDRIGGYVVLSRSLAGTRRRPWIVVATLESSPDRTYNTWSERSISSAELLWNFSPWAVTSAYAGFNVGEHAIRRIYERAYRSSDADTLARDPLCALKELKFAPLWSSYWWNLAMGSFGELPAGQINVAMPAPSGLLLGSIRTGGAVKVELRTFVGTSQLSLRQASLRQRMLETTVRYIDSPIVGAGVLVTSGMAGGFRDSMTKFASEIHEYVPHALSHGESVEIEIMIKQDYASAA